MTAGNRPALPNARGRLSAQVRDRLTRTPPGGSVALDWPDDAAALGPFPSDEEDRQLALTLCYELHYRGWSGVDDAWEWHPGLLSVVAGLEAELWTGLERMVEEQWGRIRVRPAQVPDALAELTGAELGPSLSSYLARKASADHYREFLIHRSIYHLKEADPHTWAIPRLAGPVKAALVEVQSDEYGGGRADWMHATLFAEAMRSLGLDAGYGRYLEAVPAVTLTWANTMTLFGLHRRFRGALVGHLAALEMTSSLPNRRYAAGLRRLGLGASTTRFFDEHVEADAVHEQIACHDLAGRLALAEPELAESILFGAAAALITDARVSRHLLDRWQSGESSLRSAAAQPVGLGAAGGR